MPYDFPRPTGLDRFIEPDERNRLVLPLNIGEVVLGTKSLPTKELRGEHMTIIGYGGMNTILNYILESSSGAIYCIHPTYLKLAPEQPVDETKMNEALKKIKSLDEKSTQEDKSILTEETRQLIVKSFERYCQITPYFDNLVTERDDEQNATVLELPDVNHWLRLEIIEDYYESGGRITVFKYLNSFFKLHLVSDSFGKNTIEMTEVKPTEKTITVYE